MVKCNVSLKSRYTEGIDMKVFIADDSQVVRERIIEMLSELPEIEIIGQAEDGLQAKNLIEKLNPDVVILDIRMPRRNGIEVLQNIKKKNSALTVIMLTNYPYPQYQKKCMKAGADYFFDKATEFEKVTEVLKKLILSRLVF
jgi:DNA-binding NarL/FixJ family response regulator